MNKPEGPPNILFSSMGVINRDNTGKPWTEELDKSLVNMFRRNVSIAQIADWHQRTGNSIVSRLVHLGHMAQIGTGYYMVADTPSVTMKELKAML